MKPLIRKLQPDDRAFVLSTAGAMHGIRRREAIAILDYALDMADCLIMCDDETPDLILAFIVHYRRGVVWAFTKSQYRRFGFFRDLRNEANVPVKFEYMIEGGHEWRELKRKYKPLFNPYLLWKS